MYLVTKYLLESWLKSNKNIKNNREHQYLRRLISDITNELLGNSHV